MTVKRSGILYVGMAMIMGTFNIVVINSLSPKRVRGCFCKFILSNDAFSGLLPQNA